MSENPFSVGCAHRVHWWGQCMPHAGAGGLLSNLWQEHPAQYPASGNAAYHSMPGRSIQAGSRGRNGELRAQGRPRNLGQQIRLAYHCLKLLTCLLP